MRSRVCHVSDKIDDAIYIARANPRKGLKGSPLGNPFTVKAHGRQLALSSYSIHLGNEIHQGNPTIINALIECRNRPLACWCRREGEPITDANRCHADEIIAWLDGYTDEQLRSLIEAKP